VAIAVYFCSNLLKRKFFRQVSEKKKEKKAQKENIFFYSRGKLEISIKRHYLSKKKIQFDKGIENML
jgi:hypothetical protein